MQLVSASREDSVVGERSSPGCDVARILIGDRYPIFRAGFREVLD